MYMQIQLRDGEISEYEMVTVTVINHFHSRDTGCSEEPTKALQPGGYPLPMPVIRNPSLSDYGRGVGEQGKKTYFEWSRDKNSSPPIFHLIVPIKINLLTHID